MFVVVTDEIAQGEAIVGGDEVDAGVGLAAVGGVEVGASREAVAQLGHLARVALPEAADGIAVLAVPFGPQHGKVAHLVAAFADIPGLGDELHLREDGVLVNDVEEGAQPVHFVELARECRCEVEAEAIDVHLDAPSSAGYP